MKDKQSRRVVVVVVARAVGFSGEWAQAFPLVEERSVRVVARKFGES